MNLVNKKVVHETFGKGNVVKQDDSYIRINFNSGEKRFVYPDAFRKYISFIDQKLTILVNKEIEKKEEKLKIEELELQRERAIEEEKQMLLNRKTNVKTGKVNSKIQSVFWVEPNEEEEIFKSWKVFTGEIKSGKQKGQPRRLARMNQNSACLITKRSDDVEEKDRKILGLFMTEPFFDGGSCEDGYIKADSQYRLKLSEEESEKMLFWNYYFDEKATDKTVWNSGRQRYFDNIWMAQILRDIVVLRENTEEHAEAKSFFDHFSKVNGIDQKDLPEANGTLKRIEN